MVKFKEKKKAERRKCKQEGKQSIEASPNSSDLNSHTT